MRYRNDEMGIVIFDGTYRVEEGAPVLYVKGTMWKLREVPPEKVNDNKIIVPVSASFEVPEDIKIVNEEEFVHKNKKYRRIVTRGIEEAQKLARSVVRAGNKVYEPEYTPLSYIKIKNFRPYFYVDDAEAVKLARQLIEEAGAKVERVETVEKYTLDGKKKLFKIVYNNPRITKPVRIQIEEHGFKTYEADVAFFMRFLIDMEYTINHPPRKFILYYDIEVGHEPGVFPDPKKALWPIISISTMNGAGEKETKILDPTATGIDAIKKEMEIIKWFFRKAEKHVVVTGWNSANFDMPYIMKRVKVLNDLYLKHEFGWDKKFALMREKVARDVKKKLGNDPKLSKRISEYRRKFNVTTSKAIEMIIDDWTRYRLNKKFKEWKNENYEKYKDKLIQIPLLMRDIDLLVLYKKFVDHKLPTYKLDYVARVEGFEGKKEIDIEKIVEVWRTNPDELRDYNENDVWQIAQIDEKRELIKKFFTFAGIAGVPPKILFHHERGMTTSKLIDATILRLARKINMVLPTGVVPDDEELEGKNYSGGYVHTPEPGVYDNIIVLDFNSMYPSIIISFNASADTFCETSDCDIKAPIGSFKAEPTGIAVEAVKMLFDLKMEVKHQLKKLKKELGPDAPDVKALETFYAGVKGVLNGVYGTYGYPKFRLYDKRIAENITTLGREIWNLAKEIAEKELGYKVIYGDSVAKDSRIIIRRNGKIEVVNIEDLFDGEPDYVAEDGREYKNLEGVEALTLDDDMRVTWAPIKYVMRHKANKKMYRLWLTNSQYIDVTEDHSVFVYDNKKLIEKKPREMARNDELITYVGEKLEFSKLQKIEEIDYNDYVYDIEVGGTHKFFANGILVHNTDSQYYIAKSKDIDGVIKEAGELADYLTRRIREELKKRYNARSDIFVFEPDKIYTRLIIFKKKNYVGLIGAVGTQKLDKPKFDSAGLLSRGDVSEAQKEFLEEIINLILEGKSNKEIYQAIRKWYEKLMSGELDNKLVKWKALSKAVDEYKSKQTFVKAYEYLVNVRKIPPTDLQKVGYIKVGPKGDDFIAIAPGDTVKLRPDWREFVWENQFQTLLNKFIFLVMPRIDVKTMTRQKSLSAFF